MARNAWMTNAADEAAVASSKWNEISGTPGNDDLVGTAGRDRFHIGEGGNDTAEGLGGRDWFELGGSYTDKDHIDGGDGNDTVWIGGDLADTSLSADSLKSVERFYLFNPHGNVQVSDGFGNIVFAGRYVGETVDASHLTSGSVRFLGEHAGATLIGGDKGDVFFADSGMEVFTGGGGRDRFVFGSPSDSTGSAADLITDFSTQDVVKLPDAAGGYRIASTAANPGDIAISFDSTNGQTLADINVPGSSTHLMIHFNAALDLHLVHESHLILG